MNKLSIEALASPYEAVSDKQRVQMLQVVDPTFYSHSGISFAPGQGPDTVTSAVARMVLLEGSDLPGLSGVMQVLMREIYQCCTQYDPGRYVMAKVADAKLTKDQQLQIYLANVYLGRYQGKAVYGYPSAALVYFDKRISTLSDAEWLSLVALELDPDAYHPIENPDQLVLRVRRIEQLLAGFCVAKTLNDTEYSACELVNELSLEAP